MNTSKPVPQTPPRKSSSKSSPATASASKKRSRSEDKVDFGPGEPSADESQVVATATAHGDQIDSDKLNYMSNPTKREFLVDKVNFLLNELTEKKQKVITKYARILLFQLVFTKYVIGFRNYDGYIFVVIDVIFQNVIMRKYDKI